MDEVAPPTGSTLRTTTRLFQIVEHGIYTVIGVVLSLTALLALAGAIATLWVGAANIASGDALLLIIDRLLTVLMLAEILHTVRVSITSGTLDCEPFLIVGLIASIRRILVITLKSSEAAAGNAPVPDTADAFRSSMIELGVLAGLIMVMVVSIYLLRRGRADRRAG